MHFHHKYSLQKYEGIKTRFTCPNCHKQRSFTRYVDVVTGRYIDPTVGRCDRESSCGYHYAPWQYFRDHNIDRDNYKGSDPCLSQLPVPPPVKSASRIPAELFKASLRSYESNRFISYLVKLFGIDIAANLIRQYFIGTSIHWDGATVFWQIDVRGEIRSGKVMLYNGYTGKRVKEPFSHITWMHVTLRLDGFVLSQCLFGEHLLVQHPDAPVAIVESEKTAIIASVYLPQYVWLAAGSLNNLSAEKAKPLRGKNVTLFPDLKGYDKWLAKARGLSGLNGITVSDLLERHATAKEREACLDLADYLVRFDYREFLM